MSPISRTSLVLFAALFALTTASQAQQPANQQRQSTAEADPASPGRIAQQTASYHRLQSHPDSACDQIKIGLLESERALADSWVKAVEAFRSQ